MILNGASSATVEKFIALQAEAARLSDAWARIKDYRDYYDGRHPTLLTPRQEEFLGPILTHYGEHAVTFNLCRVVVDTLRERLNVEGFTGEGAAGQALAQRVWQWWTASQMDARQITTHRRALRDGKSYVIVGWNAARGMPEWVPNRAYDGDTGVTFQRDPESGAPLLAVKYWRKTDILAADYNALRRTVYLPGLIMRQKQDSAADYGWGPISASEGPAVEYWTDTLTADGQPLGLPVIEFENPGEASEIASIIGLQNALNKALLDLLAATDTTGFQMLAVQYREGVFPAATPQDDDAATTDDLRVGPGRALELWDGTTITRIEPGDLTQLIASVDKLVGFIAGSSRTPLYYLQPFGGAEVPSGEALKQLESGLVSRAQERFVAFGDAWVEAARVAARLWLAMGGTGIAANEPLRANWGSAELRNEFTQAQVAEKHAALDVPVEVLWERQLGYSATDVAEFKQARDAAASRRLATVLGALNSGGITEELDGAGSGGPVDGAGSATRGAGAGE